MINIILSVLASFTLLLGLVSMVTPIPGGTFLIAFSLATLICTSQTARRCLQVLRTHLGWLNKGVYWVERKVGSRIKFIGEALLQTRPEKDTLEFDASEEH